MKIAAEEAFSSLPAKLRARYQNDPGQFLAALNDPEEADFLRDMGVLAPKKAAEAPEPSAATPPPPPAEKPAGTPS